MVEKGHFEEMQNILEVVNNTDQDLAKKKRQTFVMSATLSFVHKAPAYGKKGKNKLDTVFFLIKFINLAKKIQENA